MAMTAMELVASAKQTITEIDASQAQAKLGAALIDVREPEEYAAGCLPGAVNIPRGVLEFRIDGHPQIQGRRDGEVILYCQSGGRSALAAEALGKLGFTRVVSLAGGYKGWSEAGLPTQHPSR
ncbi:rhodanese-like domain-containing protein [Methylotetracoccus oryzae]|uniref:rhodanese-like domain-containing protein n=1 Tax=Methylotetracoccus oryzae TaxID=1919059 RepID=UPI0011186E04|nr:rhodanese-like domain-containing protein [Methylotetracoccus oryzae]